ncbi:hypothetical protein [Trichocoleus sp. FACHB-262]|uniref:hypothetical protein n=1 Tax=Trichocoleus sp. FACHB-262 TaxID=2692869 RepID=UPI001681CB50|nr:hypothetical protein [Trichocoleus sp. FACHB-262]MBD2120442.1 hypothetical protein [Trichocoleus sp. FACHB-262]
MQYPECQSNDIRRNGKIQAIAPLSVCHALVFECRLSSTMPPDVRLLKHFFRRAPCFERPGDRL